MFSGDIPVLSENTYYTLNEINKMVKYVFCFSSFS